IGVAFTIDIVERVLRPVDDKVSYDALKTITQKIDTAYYARFNTLKISIGGLFSLILPNRVMPIARLRMRQMLGDLVLDAESDKLNKTLAKAAESGEQLILNLLGEAVLGEDEARSRAERTLPLIRNPQVTYVSVKASSMVAQLNPWDIEGSLRRLK